MSGNLESQVSPGLYQLEICRKAPLKAPSGFPGWNSASRALLCPPTAPHRGLGQRVQCRGGVEIVAPLLLFLEELAAAMPCRPVLATPTSYQEKEGAARLVPSSSWRPTWTSKDWATVSRYKSCRPPTKDEGLQPGVWVACPPPFPPSSSFP
jgi:hypothetical protein